MRTRFFALSLLLAIALAGAAAPAATAQTANVSADDPGQDCTESIDNVTAICSSTVETRGTEKVAVLVVQSSIYQRVTVTDAGAVWLGGDVPRRSPRLQEGRNTVTIPVNEHNGAMALTIDTGRTLYGEPLTRGGGALLPGSPSATDPLVVGGTVTLVFVVGMPVSFWAVRNFRGGRKDVA